MSHLPYGGSSHYVFLPRAQKLKFSHEITQVRKTEEMTAAATKKATDVEGQARAVANAARSAAQASQMQQKAFVKAKALAGDAAAAGDKASAAFRCVLSVLCQGGTVALTSDVVFFIFVLPLYEDVVLFWSENCLCLLLDRERPQASAESPSHTAISSWY